MLYRSVYESLDRPLCVKNNWCLIGTFTLIWLTAQKWEVIYCYISCEVIPHCSLYKNLRQIWERKRKSLHSFVSCILNIRIIPRGKSSAFLHLTGQTISDQKNLTMLDMCYSNALHIQSIPVKQNVVSWYANILYNKLYNNAGSWKCSDAMILIWGQRGLWQSRYKKNKMRCIRLFF